VIIKLLLLAAFVTLALVAARTTPSPGILAVRRIFIMGALATSALAVLFPDAVTRAAKLVGVGRGTDLVLYVFIVVAIVGWLGTYRRLLVLEGRFAHLVRSQAIAEASRQPPPLLDTAGDR
jgi:small membrane protein